VRPTEEVNLLISSLTNDEDQRQELWAHYLNGNAPSSLASHLEHIQEEDAIEVELQSQLYRLFKAPPSDKLHELLSHFSPIEQSIVCLLALGLSIEQVSGYKRISEVRIRQVISIIRENDCWEELYGIKEEINTRREVRTE
jgi:hypothetical protein